MTALRYIALSATCLVLASCDNMKKSSSSDPYASNYGNDGHYNPYPGQSGYASSTPNYQTPPAPPSLPPEPAINPYEFSSSKKVASSSTSSTPKKSTAKKTSTASKSTSKKSSGSRYTVVKGDTLSAIVRKKGSSVAKIKAANGLKSDLIRPGQSLKIP